MYSEKENKPEPETKERFIQTYLVISGLLLTALPDKGQFNEIVLSGFGIFLAFILLYYIIPTVTKANSYNYVFADLSYVFAFVASFGLSIQILYIISPTNNYISSLIIAFSALIECTLIPERLYQWILVPAIIMIIGIRLANLL